MEIKKIDSVSISVRDVAKSSRFYADVLGLPEIWRMDDRHMVGYGVGDNSATINIEQAAQTGMEIIIQVEAVGAARKALEQKGVRFDGETFTIPEIGDAAKFRDPDGNRFMVMDYSIEHAREAASR